MSENVEPRFDQWCLVELMGHARIAGRVTEESLFGTALMRVDVPATQSSPAFTKYYGAAAIYGVTPTSEAIARAAAERIDARPIQPWQMAALPASTSEDEPNDDDRSDYQTDDDEPFDPRTNSDYFADKALQ